MLIGGVVGSALMLGAGAIAVSNASPAGPGQEATWPAGETMSLNNIPGERGSDYSVVICTLTPEGRPAEPGRSFAVDVAQTPDFVGAATITCGKPVALLAGTPRVVAEYARGPLVAVPMFVAALGILFFFPRFTYHWARFGTPAWARRLFRR